MLLMLVRIIEIFQSTLPARGATAAEAVSGCCRTFQSTLPARGATAQATPPAIAQAHFNPRSPHGERPTWGAKKYASEDISIHAPRTGSDLGSKLLQVQINISIHAPRTGSDTDGSFVEAVTLGISIHAPRTGSDLQNTKGVSSR